MINLRFPQTIEAHERFSEMQEMFRLESFPLWEKAQISIPILKVNLAMEEGLRFIYGIGKSVFGLETIEKRLAREQKGLEERAEATQSKDPRFSRMLLITRGGSERFYRGCERLLYIHNTRLQGILLDTDSAYFGQLLFHKEKLIKVMLITEKDAVVQFLQGLLR